MRPSNGRLLLNCCGVDVVAAAWVRRTGAGVEETGEEFESDNGEGGITAEERTGDGG